MNRFIACEPNKCIGCRTCEIACAVAHASIAGAECLQPQNFAPRLRLVTTARTSTPVTCHQCDDAPCLNACPVNALVYSHDSVQVDRNLCVGCKSCVIACPFGIMEVVKVSAQRTFAGLELSAGARTEPHKCDLCLGRDAGPACVEVCPTKALHLMDDDAMQATLSQRQQRAAVETAATIAVA